MDFPAFSSICSSNKAECDVNAVWKRCECQSFFCSSCRFAREILCRWEDEESKRRRDKKTKSQKDKETKRGRDEGSKRRRDEETKSQRDEGTKRRKDEETKGRREEGTRRRKPRHLLFTSYSCRVLFTSQFVQFLFNSCPKTFARFVSKTVLHNRTPLRERSVKVNVGGKVGVGGTGK